MHTLVRIPLYLAASISRKSSAVSLRFWKGAKKKNASASAGEAQNEGTNTYQAGRIFAPSPSLPLTPLPLSFLRSGGGSSKSSPNGSEIVIGNTRVGGDGRRNILDAHDIALESRQSLSRLSFQDGELRDTKSTLPFPSPTFANERTLAATVRSRSDLRLQRTAAVAKDRENIDGEQPRTDITAARTYRISVVDVAHETIRSRLDSQHSHPTTSIDRDSLSVADVRRVSRKIEMKLVTDVESALPVVGSMDAEDDEKLSIPEEGKKQPSQMIFTLSGESEPQNIKIRRSDLTKCTSSPAD